MKAIATNFLLYFCKPQNFFDFETPGVIIHTKTKMLFGKVHVIKKTTTRTEG